MASTLKLLRGGVASSDVTGAADPLDVADALDVALTTQADLDLGVMVKVGVVSLGATARNVTRPTFGSGSDTVNLERQVRSGIALTSKAFAGFDAITVAADADLMSTPTLFGNVRHAAMGGEAWLAKRRLGFRGGITTNTVGARRTAISTGVSVAPIRGLYIEAAHTTGEDGSLKGWNSSFRLTF